MTAIKKVAVFLLAVFVSTPAQTSVFGDANRHNGVEDQRLMRKDAHKWPTEFKSVGRIFCQGVVQGSGVLFEYRNSVGERSPGLLTAKHVLSDFDLADCSFAPEGDSWKRSGMVAVLAQGVAPRLSGIPAKYSEDWAVIQLAVWKGWQRKALKRRSISTEPPAMEPIASRGYRAHMVGFDVMRNTMVAHLDCEFGLSGQSDLLSGHSKLFWDDCDTTQGGSGSALFAEVNGRYRLVGFRVGSLFDEAILGRNPEMGSQFDVHSNINVSRAVFSEMFEPVCTFAKMGCEPVGNNDSLVEN